jgi:hypothetical protein
VVAPDADVSMIAARPKAANDAVVDTAPDDTPLVDVIAGVPDRSLEQPAAKASTIATIRRPLIRSG